jgi:hypothetical protein
MKVRVGIFAAVAALALFFAAVVSAQDLEPGVTYVCNGERLMIDSCNIRDTSDTSKCMVGHPDTVLANGLMKYTYETRGDLKKLLPTCKQPTPEELAKVKAFNKKVNDTQAAAQKKAEDDLKAQVAQQDAQIARMAYGDRKPQSPEQRALARCVEAGRPQTVCMGNSLMKPFEQVVGSVLPELTKPLPPGPDAAGNFEGAGWRMEFDDRWAVVNCGTLVPEQHEYSVSMRNGQEIITIDTEPKPVVLTVRADGRLVGSGPVTLAGHVVAGYGGGGTTTTPGHFETHDVTTHQELTPLEAQPHSGESGLTQNGQMYDLAQTHTELEYTPGATVNTGPQVSYAPKTEACAMPSVSSAGAAPSRIQVAESMLNSLFSDESLPKVPAGLRMRGEFGDASGASVEFYPDSAIIGCGEAVKAVPYSVQVSGGAPVVALKEDSAAYVFTIRPDGTLAGPGMVLVHGRVITGQNDDGFTFAPLNASCNFGTLSPGTAGGAPPGGATASAAGAATAAPTAAPATGSAGPGSSAAPMNRNGAAPNAILSVSSGFTVPAGAPNPVAGRAFVLLRDSFDNVLAKGGFATPQGESSYIAMLKACAGRSPDCQKASDAINSAGAAGMRLDGTGKATFAAVPPGTYYLMGSGVIMAPNPADRKMLFWNLRVELRPGTNAVTLDTSNGTPVHP